MLGADPETGREVTLRAGRHGPYVQLAAAEAGGRPSSAPLPPDRPLDLDLPKRTAKAFAPQPKAEMRVAALLPPPRDLRGTIPLD